MGAIARFGFTAWVMMWAGMPQQDLLERRGEKNILEFSGIIPGIYDLDLFDILFGTIEDPVVAPFPGAGAVFMMQYIIIPDRAGQRQRQIQAGMPELLVHIFHWKGFLRVIIS